MQSEKVRVGIIGAGAVARIAHVPGYAADPRVEVVGITDLNQERAGELAAQFNVPKVYSSADAMLSEGRLDAVSICVANAFHAPLALQALRSGADVLVEKPMALSTAERPTDPVFDMEDFMSGFVTSITAQHSRRRWRGQ
ncbi:MAG: Gfo/Idh/MocA family oxidoreductase [Chloroflexota bacterium]|nr:Gfo/Idh/MocA family oxidoreductase [Chloroflexota bacterium]